MHEDERYRTSTQFRHWSFTPTALAAQRAATNRNAADRVREAVRRLRESRIGEMSGVVTAEGTGETTDGGEVDCLSVDEEMRLLEFYCRQTLQLGDFLKVPTDVKATAIQYIKRFYITNSLMTYHPTDILKTALYFATKTENHYFRLTKFAEMIGKTTPEAVLASEFLLTQGLRFTFDIRHPFRALEGAVMELQAMSLGAIPVAEGVQLPLNMERRVREAHGKARELLKTSALLTDVYFYYTPSQIMMAALLATDEDLARWYMEGKMAAEGPEMVTRVLLTVTQCADMLRAVQTSAEPSAEERKELQVLAKKLKRCRNPEKMDLIGLQKAKREGGVADEEKVIKKRKMEEKAAAAAARVDDLFGPSLKRP